MDDNMNEAIAKNINEILENFTEMGIYNYNSKDADKIMENMYSISYIIFKIISILKQPNLSSKDKRVYLTMIKINNTSLLDSDTIDIILENEEHYINMFKIFNKFKTTSSYYQQTGGDDTDDHVFKNIPLVNKLPDGILYPADKILFPLYAVEDTIPITTIVFDMMLFLSTFIGMFVKIITPMVNKMMKFGINIFFTIIGAIPMVGTVSQVISVPVKIGFSIFSEFIVGVMKASPNLYKFMIQLSRKNFGDAVREFSKTTVVFSQLYNLLDKALPLLNNSLMFLTEYMPLIIKYSEPFAGIFLKTIATLNNVLKNLID